MLALIQFTVIVIRCVERGQDKQQSIGVYSCSVLLRVWLQAVVVVLCRSAYTEHQLADGLPHSGLVRGHHHLHCGARHQVLEARQGYCLWGLGTDHGGQALSCLLAAAFFPIFSDKLMLLLLQ